MDCSTSTENPSSDSNEESQSEDWIPDENQLPTENHLDMDDDPEWVEAKQSAFDKQDLVVLAPEGSAIEDSNETNEHLTANRAACTNSLQDILPEVAINGVYSATVDVGSASTPAPSR
jgi:hypothetical protein